MISSKVLVSIQSHFRQNVSRINAWRLGVFNSEIECGQGSNISLGARIVLVNGASLKLKPGVNVGAGSFIYLNGCHCEIGERAFFGRDTSVICRSGLIIGDNFLMAERAVLMVPKNKNTVNVKENVWLGAGSAVYGAGLLKKGAILGANSQAFQDLPEFSINIGSPSTTKKYVGKVD